MAAAGLLDGRQATLHWDELDRFAETFPEVDAQAHRWVDDGQVLTCGGASTAFELMLHQIGTQHGAMLRLEVAALFMMGERPTPQATEGEDAMVLAATALMRRHIEAPLPIAAIARTLGLTTRALERQFAKVLGHPPAATYRALRLNAARRLVVQTRMSITEIATRTGYETPAAMTRAFRARFGVPPRRMRSGATVTQPPRPSGSVRPDRQSAGS
jgi:transcriptional regulator GlxA family with amidase domain